MEPTARTVFPRITRAYAKSLIALERFSVDEEMAVVVCRVQLINKHRLVSYAIVGNPDQFDPERGKQVAREKMIDKIIDREMYLLRTRLHEKNSKEVGDADRDRDS